jgi:uncharacterized protein YbjT (DUF2867 family)
MKGVDKLFLINAVVADELTQALIAYGIAKRIGLKHVTYLSVFKVQEFRDVPHFASKLAVEGALREFGVPYTILRPGYYMQNDIGLRDALTGPGLYPMPLGTAGVAAADMRDIAEVAAISLTEEGHEEQTYDIVAPSLISGPGNAALWSKLLGKEIKYTGHDFDEWRPLSIALSNSATAPITFKSNLAARVSSPVKLNRSLTNSTSIPRAVRPSTNIRRSTRLIANFNLSQASNPVP